MASQSPSTKRRQKNQENENDLLKYFKRMRVNESSQSTSAPILTIDNLPSNTQLNVLQSIENIDKSITRKISPENNILLLFLKSFIHISLSFLTSHFIH
jgi:hypothetical protein